MNHTHIHKLSLSFKLQFVNKKNLTCKNIEKHTPNIEWIK